MKRKALVLVVCAAAMLECGCGPKDPLDTRVKANDPVDFATWQSDMSDKLTAEQQGDLRDAMQELRYHIMAGGTSNSDQVNAAVLDQVREKTLRQVLEKGLGWKLQREEKERADLAEALHYNVESAARPNADLLADRQGQIQNQQGRLKAADEDISRIRSRLTADGLSEPTPPPAK
ncbi:MAG TPA: hypothetical protein VGG34_14955 [Opitutaceae bacterium]|jgi:hypothetical protein